MCIRDRQHIVVGGAYEHLLHDVLSLAGHAGDAASAAALCLIGGLELDVYKRQAQAMIDAR